MSQYPTSRSEAERSGELTASGETIAVVRKKVLLRLLARESADRSKLSVSESDLAQTSEQFRREFDLMEDKQLTQWMAKRRISPAAYLQAMRDFTLVRLLEEAYAARIDELVADHVAVSSVRLGTQPCGSHDDA